MQIRKAKRTNANLRIALIGPSGSGKTYTSLRLAHELAEGKPVLLIDSERGSGELYAPEFPEYSTIQLGEDDGDYSPENYVKALQAAKDNGFGVVIIDSLSHAWIGRGGALDMAAEAEKRQRIKNSYTAWREVTPAHNAMVQAILDYPGHIIATMRAKTKYELTKGEDGKNKVEKLGMEAEQRNGLEYEFTVVGDMDMQNNFITSKTRISALAERVFKHAEGVAKEIRKWMATVEPSEIKKPVSIEDQIKACKTKDDLSSLYDKLSEKGSITDAIKSKFTERKQELTKA